MKKIIGFLVLIAIGCESIDTQPLPSSMKGYELYSWEENGQWKFTLITGTNRNKTYEEVVAAENLESNAFVKITTNDVREIKAVLSRISGGEYISWINRPIFVAGFSLPPASMVHEIEKHCKNLGLDLHIII